ncbi:hypothetical protein AURDEDRAFT_131155 [Auricularia subglabra TFB-10046 SS5]|uniref:F-box domain-containing protein n=1 Tax=Auricularia subglabra (strain TFB-10046 / SS5) TaxID=717982 RepID=J0CVN9_AURST|nr:hypothetical protein AURDEDRAFT_131155 [Auricularia subglabra TFB-10046 SS5]
MNQLPLELWTKVMRYVLIPLWQLDPPSRDMLRVCSRWKGVIENTPSFWQHISLTTSTTAHIAKTHCARAGGMDLHIFLYSNSTVDSELLDILVAHAWHVKTLRLVLPSNAVRNLLVFPFSWPRLSSLDIKASGEPGADLSTSVKSSGAILSPLLTELHLTGNDINIAGISSIINLGRLTVLGLRSMIIHPADLEAILARCQSLRAMSLEYLVERPSAILHSDTPAGVMLVPSEVSLRDISTGLAAVVLRLLADNNLVKIHCQRLVGKDGLDRFLHILSSMSERAMEGLVATASDIALYSHYDHACGFFQQSSRDENLLIRADSFADTRFNLHLPRRFQLVVYAEDILLHNHLAWACVTRNLTTIHATTATVIDLLLCLSNSYGELDFHGLRQLFISESPFCEPNTDLDVDITRKFLLGCRTSRPIAVDLCAPGPDPLGALHNHRACTIRWFEACFGHLDSASVHEVRIFPPSLIGLIDVYQAWNIYRVPSPPQPSYI